MQSSIFANEQKYYINALSFLSFVFLLFFFPKGTKSSPPPKIYAQMEMCMSAAKGNFSETFQRRNLCCVTVLSKNVIPGLVARSQETIVFYSNDGTVAATITHFIYRMTVLILLRY